MFCEGLNGRGRQITYFDVLKDFGFMEAKGFDVGFIFDVGLIIADQEDAVSPGKNIEI